MNCFVMFVMLESNEKEVDRRNHGNRLVLAFGTFRAYLSSSPKKDKIIRESNDIFCNYEMQQKTWVFLSTTFPWDSSSAYAARAWILASREHVLVFSEKSTLKFAACFGFENAGGQ